MMNLEQLLRKEPDGVLLDMQLELMENVIPATGYVQAYRRKVNKMIDAGNLCINSANYRRLYLPTMAHAIQKELARRYVMHLMNTKVI